jgi:hypothetical protein
MHPRNALGRRLAGAEVLGARGSVVFPGAPFQASTTLQSDLKVRVRVGFIVRSLIIRTVVIFPA